MVRLKGRRLRFMAPARKQGADRESLVKYTRYTVCVVVDVQMEAAPAAAPIFVPGSQPTSSASAAPTVIRALVLLGGLRRRVSLYNKDPSVVTPFKPARPSKWGVLRAAVGTNTFLTRLLDNQRSRADRSSFMQRMHAQQGKQAAVVGETSQDGGVGDQKLDESTVLDALSYASRQGLRQHRRVLLSLEAWWRCCSELCGGVEAINEGQYFTIFKKIYRGMVSEYDEEEAVSSVREVTRTRTRTRTRTLPTPCACPNSSRSRSRSSNPNPNPRTGSTTAAGRMR